MSLKTGLVADILHGIIPVSNVEQFVLATPIFNRLHSVKQNSTAYLTYPSMVHSRYEHSLGAMHITGQMLSNGILNASEEVRLQFLVPFDALIKALCNSNAVVPTTGCTFANLSKGEREKLLTLGAKNIRQLYDLAPSSLPENLIVVHTVVLQAVRLAALVHDLGHTPFSHVAEYAVKEIASRVKTKMIKVENEDCFKAISLLNETTSASGKEIHEELTSVLFCKIFETRKGDSITSTSDQAENTIFSIVSMALAIGILDATRLKDMLGRDEQLSPEQTLGLSCLRSLEDGLLDGDRLDYVQRDVVMSGIREKGFRSQRLLGLLKLAYDDLNKEEKKKYPAAASQGLKTPRIIPSIRSIRSFEEFCEWRTALYETVIYHHHVVKTDAIFQLLIEQLSATELGKPLDVSGLSFQLSSSTQSLRWLWRIFKLTDGNAVAEDIYLQWDDHWLMSVLRGQYLSHRNRIKQNLTSSNVSDEIEFRRLEEIVANRKNYRSVVKRFEDYRTIQEGFFTEWIRLVSDWRSEPDASYKDSDASNRIALLNRFFEPTSKNSEKQSERTIFDLLPLALIDSGSLNLAAKDAKQAMTDLLNTATARVKEKEGLLDLFWKNKEIKPAVGSDFKIYTDSGLEDLVNHSDIGNEFKARLNKTLKYFFYALPTQSSTTTPSPKALRESLGKCLASALFDKYKTSLPS